MSSEPTTAALVAAVDWAAAVLGGSAAAAIAILAVAILGAMMLTGRLPARRGAAVIVGCFVLFGAGTIARGLTVTAEDAATQEAIDIAPDRPAYTPVPARAAAFDPYAGASVPNAG